ncbi:MAG: SDR family oxidoreductase [Propionibacteriaceae bacterium]|nr:SDR family oxidoreductase [Propionibacteriaceae bacterium]
MVKSVAREYSRLGLGILAISPGPITGTMSSAVMDPGRIRHYEAAIPLGRFAQPREVAQAIVWALCDAPAPMTGVVLDIDGGLVRR